MRTANTIARRVLLIVAASLGTTSVGCNSPDSDARVSRDAVPPTAQQALSPDAGKTVYDANCASCHILGNHDKEGDSDLKGHQRGISKQFVARHADVTLDEQSIANLKAFIAGQ